MAPIVIRVSRLVNLNPTPVLIAVALSSNMSGSALLVGDPQAALVASAFNLAFTDFIFYMSNPSMFFVVTAAMIAAIATLPLYVHLPRLKFHVPSHKAEVKNKPYMYLVVAGLLIKIILLSLRKELGLSLTAAAAPSILPLIVIYGRSRIMKILRESIDTKLMIFLACVFYLVELVDIVSLTELAAKIIEEISGNILMATIVIILLSAVMSSIMDNVPFIAAMIPVIDRLSRSFNVDPVVVAWALLLGATIGGNITYIGASANYTAVRILEREGYNITFWGFTKIGLPFTIISLAVGSLLYYAFYLDELIVK